MDFGVQINSRSFGGFTKHVQTAESLGYTAIWMPDHFIYENPGGDFDAEQPVFEQLTMLCGLAAVSEKIRLGTHVICTLFRQPALTAKMLTTLDHISDGRLIAGFGAGWTKREFDMMGIDYPDVSTRLRIMEEHIDVVRALWTESKANYSGEFYTLTDAVAAPKPVQTPHPPIMLGGNGKGVIRRAAKFADMLNIVVSLGKQGTTDLAEVAKLTEGAFKTRVALLHSELDKHGRPKDAVRLSTTVFQFMLTDSPETTKSIHENVAGMYGLNPDDVGHMPLVLIGTADECIQELKYREAEWGLDHVILNATNSRDMKSFGEAIIPAFA